MQEVPTAEPGAEAHCASSGLAARCWSSWFCSSSCSAPRAVCEAAGTQPACRRGRHAPHWTCRLRSLSSASSRAACSADLLSA